MLITFEGIDGSGKSLQAKLLHTQLQALAIPSLLLREPGGTPIGDALRGILLSPDYALAPIEQAFLFSASRAALVRHEVLPALERGEVVIIDRFTDSTLVYQGVGDGLDPEMLAQLNAWSTGNLCPNLTIYLDIDPVVGLARKRAQGEVNHLDELAAGKGNTFRQAYFDLMALDPARWKYFESATPDRVAKAIMVTVQLHHTFPLRINL